MNPVRYLVQNVCEYMMEEEQPWSASKLVRVHNEKLRAHGDISFPLNKQLWEKMESDICFLRPTGVQLLDEAADQGGTESRDDFLSLGRTWVYPLQSVQFKNERCILNLQRKLVTTNLLTSLLGGANDAGAPPFGYITKNPARHIYIADTAHTGFSTTNISLYRAKMIRDILKRVLEYSEWIVEDDPLAGTGHDPLVQVRVISIATKGRTVVPLLDETVEIKCGLVIEPSTGCLATMESNEYLELRRNDMEFLTMHKKGVMVRDEHRFNMLMQRLGEAAVTVDFLEVKHSSPVQLIRNRQGSTKGAAFLLYNSARLETLLRKFDEGVAQSTYSQLPDIHDIDFSLLNEDEEWRLVYAYMLTFPHLIECVVDQLEYGHCATHLIVRFLTGFVGLFSTYYRRIRILLATSDHLHPLVYARICLVKAVRKVLNMTLALLDIEPVQFI